MKLNVGSLRAKTCQLNTQYEDLCSMIVEVVLKSW